MGTSAVELHLEQIANTLVLNSDSKYAAAQSESLRGSRGE